MSSDFLKGMLPQLSGEDAAAVAKWAEMARDVAIVPTPAPNAKEEARADVVYNVRNLADLALRTLDLRRGRSSGGSGSL